VVFGVTFGLHDVCPLQRGAGTDRHCYESEAKSLVGFALKGKPE
jgi:hypothetical protein